MSGRADQIGSPERAGARREYEDGLLECAAGALLLLLAAGWVDNPALLPIGVALVMVFGPVLLRRLKETVTYPRIDHVDRRVDRHTDNGIEIIGFFLFVAFSFALFLLAIALTGNVGDVDGWRRWSGLLAGALTAGGFLAAGEHSRLWRHLALAVTSVVTGFGTSLLSTGGDYAAVGWFFLTMGLLVSTVGLVILIRFVQRNPKSEA